VRTINSTTTEKVVYWSFMKQRANLWNYSLPHLDRKAVWAYELTLP